jgi:ACDE family multidrug resistance protein
MPRQPLPLLAVLLAAGTLTAMVGGIVTPVFPDVVAVLRVDPQWAGLLVSTHTLTMALFSPIGGILADRWGKRPVLLVSLVLYAITGMAGAAATGFWTMWITRLLVGAASGGVAAASIGLLSTLYDGEARSRMLGYATSALATTSIFFPLLGGWLGSFQWQYAFFLYGLGIPTAIAVVLIIPARETAAGGISLPQGQQRQAFFRTLSQPNIMLLLATLALASAVFYVVIVYAPLFYRQAINADSAVNGAILAARAIGAAIISAVGASRLAKAVGRSRAIALGFLIMGLMLLSIPVLTQVPIILLAAVVFGVGYGVVMPNLYDSLAILTTAELRTSVLAIGTGMANLGQFMSPLFLGPVWKHGGIWVFWLGAGLAVAIAVAAAFRRSLEAGRP